MLRTLPTLLLLACGFLATSAQTPDATQLADWLRRYPDADANHDGVLTLEEARSYREKVRATRAGANPRATETVRAGPATPSPTFADLAYGTHPRQVLDFWRADSAAPAPVVVYIHGGGFVQGDKSRARESELLRECLAAGVSFAAINYRFLSTDTALPDILRDCARAVQFIRAHATEWNLDKDRLATFGSSAGAGASLWLAFHADLADPSSADPVARESSRPACVGALSTQFTYDFPRWAELFGEDMVARFGGRYNAPAFYGFATREEVLGPAGQRVRADCDMHGLMQAGAPPFFVQSDADAVPARTVSEFLHHPLHAKALVDRAREVGVRSIAVVPSLGLEPAAGDARTLREFLLRELGMEAPSPPAPSRSR